VHVIGTAGHVDHGKTTLIEALTGINPDRLPEEKARGMTIDLGFAWFPGENGEPVGVIDVPGHERFIRNMVAGAWSLDSALLLVAADDGWMQQTQDHAVVLSFLGVGSVILVVTKTDAATADRAEEVRRDALARCRKIFGFEPPSIEVSALEGRNVDALKRLIIGTLSGLSNPRARGFPFIYVDRVFTIKGSGLVVTGSLKGAPLSRNEELVLLPQQETLRVRGIQTYNMAVNTAVPTSRVALNLSKPRSEIRRGDCITTPGSPFSCEREMVARAAIVESELKNHSEIEIALGTGHEIAQIHFMDDPRFARIQLRNPIPALWNQPFLIIRHGGSTILGTGRVLWHGGVAREDRRRLTKLLSSLPGILRDEDRSSLELRFHGLARMHAGARPGGDLSQDTVILGQWVFHAPWLEKLKTGILALAALPGGISARELESKLGVDGEALKAALGSLLDGHGLVASNNLYFGEGQAGKALDAGARRLLEQIVKTGTAGFELSRAGADSSQKDLKTLFRSGLVTPLEGGICYAKESYDSLVSKVLEGREKGERFSIPQAKESTGLSRKYMIPLLNRMEKDGLLRRDGDARVVL